ncbi:MAG: TerC family protein [Cyclobacteriaceae bacterium]|nr:TerC family protein [Cyclobacteriaceae bacterium]
MIFIYSIFDSSNEAILFSIFGLIIFLFLAIDLGVFNKKAHTVSTKSALFQSIFWVIVSCSFGVAIYFYDGGVENTLEYFSAYLTEYALSVDNIFVILLILRFFKVELKYYHKILFWGILGALVFRAVFIFAGALLVRQFEFVLYIFGAFLVYSGIKIYFEEGETEVHPENNIILKFANKYLRISKDDRNGKFFFVENGKLFFTSLFLVIMLIETTDLIFAVDSIPAAFAITQSEFLIYTSNIFAVLGLRAKFFLLAGVIDKFHLLQKGLSVVLIFIGGKMLLEMFNIHVSIIVSFSVILGTLAMSILLSLMFPEKKKEDPQLDIFPAHNGADQKNVTGSNSLNEKAENMDQL